MPGHDDIGLFLLGDRLTVHADGGAERIQIGKAVAHDQYIFTALNQFLDGGGRDTRMYLCPFFDAHGDAAEELIGVSLLDGCLISAAAERHIERLLGLVSALLDTVPAADADGERQPLNPCIGKAAHIRQHAKFIVDHPVELAVLCHRDKAGISQPAHKGRVFGHPVFNDLFHAARNGSALGVPKVLRGLKQIVSGDVHHRRMHSLIFLRNLLERCVVDKEEHIHGHPARPAAAERPGVDRVHPIPVDGGRAADICQLLKSHIANKGVHILILQLLIPQDAGTEQVIVPDDLTRRIRSEDGQRKALHRFTLRQVQRIIQALDRAIHPALQPASQREGGCRDNQCRRQLRKRELPLPD